MSGARAGSGLNCCWNICPSLKVASAEENDFLEMDFFLNGLKKMNVVVSYLFEIHILS